MKKYLFIIIALISFWGCNNLLEEEVYSELGPSNFYSSEEDAESLLNATYSQCQKSGMSVRDWLFFSEGPTDIFLDREGGIYTYFKPLEEFTWDASHSYLYNQWTSWYKGIFYANTVIDNVPSIDMDEDRKEQIIAEARFLRALNYYWLNDLWGPVPLVLTSETTPQDRPIRPTNDEIYEFIENEFIAVSEILPLTQEEFPRATKGAALGFLTKFYLNNKKWELAAETAKKVIDSHVYDICIGEKSRAELFEIDNETSNEFIYVVAFSSQTLGNNYSSHAVPDNYVWKYKTLTNYATEFSIRTEFLNTFDPKDQRLDAFIFKYLSTSGDTVTLGKDDVRSWKYPEDPNQVGSTSNDFPLLRYTDILLSRAEALNEINGPTQEAIDLINQIRYAAGVNDLVLANYTKESLRDAILAERGWEFHTEGLRRQDLIRHGKFISSAIERGWNAENYRVLYAIPQSEIDVNPNLVQNDGYK